MIKHVKNCDCFECADPYIQHLNEKYLKADKVDSSGRVDNADKKTAAYFLDSTLVARKPVDLKASPSDTSTVIKTFPKGTNVGIIYSYVVKDGQVWWDVNWFSGKHAGWVKHDSGLFDSEIAEQTSSQKKFDEKQIELQKKMDKTDSVNPLNAVGKVIGGTSDMIGSIFGNLKWIMLAAIILFVLYFAYNTFKK